MISAGKESFSAISNVLNTPQGLTPGAINFFMAANEGNQSCMDVLSSLAFAQLAGPAQPVYGPSRAPRHQQFVDLITDSSGANQPLPLPKKGNAKRASTLSVDNAHVAKHPSQDSEGQNRVVHFCNNGSVSLQTPEKVEMPQMLRQVSVGAPTPSSGMGMTASPATGCRYITYATPGSALIDETCTRTYLRSAPVSFVASTGANTDTIISIGSNSFMSLPSAALPTVKVPLDDNPTSLAVELEQAYEEHVHESKRKAGGKAKRKEKRVQVTVGYPVCVDLPMMLPGSPEEQMMVKEETEPGRRRRERRQSKGRNKQKGDNSHNGAFHHDGGFVSDFSEIHANTEAHAGCGDKKFLVTLRCHGSRDVTAVCCSGLSKEKHLIFEADRGFDLGEVVGVKELMSEPSRNSTPARVVRAAYPEDVENWKGALLEMEKEAVVECRHACSELGLTIRVVGAIYQFDRQKLTFLYESNDRVDFRLLLQVMYSRFHCRIWMERRSRGHSDIETYTV